MSIGRSWNGRAYGTNTGNVAVTLEGEDAALSGVLRLNDNEHGVAVYEVVGKYDAGKLDLTGKPQIEPSDNVVLGELTVFGSLTNEGRIDGEWSTTLGTGGTFQLWPHSYDSRPSNVGAIPEQLNTFSRTTGALRLYADDVPALIGQLVKDFGQKRAVVTFNDRGIEKNIYSDEFERILDTLPELNYLKISVQEPEIYGLNRNAMFEFVAWGDNVVRVQSVQESWAIGKAESLFRHVTSFERSIATQFRKFGLNINIFITVVALAALPGLPGFWQRLIFAIAIVAIQTLITFAHSKLVPNFALFPGRAKASPFGKIAPGLISWSITILGGVIAAVIYGALKGELNDSPLFGFLRSLLN